MPNWQPNWQDVVWDWGAANQAINALRRAADMLDESAATRRQLAGQAQEEWRGKYRDQFDVRLAKMMQTANGLAAEYRAAAGRIARASEDARNEQNRRERDRERWHREKREEERRERERRRRRRQQRAGS